VANQDWFISNAFSCSGGGDVTNQFLGLRGQAVARRNDELAIGFHVGEYGRMYALPDSNSPRTHGSGREIRIPAVRIQSRYPVCHEDD
jgi:hypothetical protein